MTDKPQWTGTTEILKSGNIPRYDYAEMAAKAMAALAHYNELCTRERGEVVQFDDVNRDTAQKALQGAKDAGRQNLSASEVYTILDAYRIPAAKWRLTNTPEEAAKAAEEIGLPVVLKADSEAIVHKSDVGGVKVNLQDANAVKSAAQEMVKKFGAKGLRFFVQEFMPAGREVIIGAKAEAGLGHTVMFGLGGVMVELMKDVSFELTPIAPGEAKEMLTSIKSYPLLSGFRGQEGVDQQKLIEVIQRVSQLVTDLPMIQEMDLNPIIAYKDRAFAVDARILI